MGGSSSSSSSSSNYSSIDNSLTQNYNYTDAGAIEAGENIAVSALDLANSSIESVGKREAQALTAMQDFGENAMSLVANSYKESDAETMQSIFKYSAITAAVIASAYLLKGKK
jgi:hypothetical protein